MLSLVSISSGPMKAEHIFLLAKSQIWPRSPVLIMMIPMASFSSEAGRYYRTCSRLRKRIQQRGSPVVFVPYYISQDIERERFMCWDETAKCARRLYGNERLLWRDWLARIAPVQSRWDDGIFIRDFWATFSQDNRDDRARIAKVAGTYYVDPLIQWRE